MTPARAVLITGAAVRVGAAIARTLAADGWRVVVHYNRSSEEAEALAAEAPVDVNRMLHGIFVRRPGTEGAVAREAHELARVVDLEDEVMLETIS